MAKRGAAVLEIPEPDYAPENGTRRHASTGPAARLRRGPVEDFADEYPASTEPPRGHRRPVARPVVKFKLAGQLLPRSTAGLVATGVALLLLLGAVFWLLAVTRTFLLHDARFRLAGASSIEIEGNHHLSRAQLLGLFADDIDRNIFGVSLDQRRADLEAISWVQHATVMRLLPGRLRVSLVERTPVAFVRQGGRIGLVDAHGVLLDMPAGPQPERFSFPVVTGIMSTDPASTRAARMKILERFTAELDANGARNTDSLSEIDLSNPEDVRALVDEHGATVLVHFGEDQFLERFDKVKELLPQWHAQYPNLASADMRYEHEIPLAMTKQAVTKPAVSKPQAVAAPTATQPSAKPAIKPLPPAAVHAALPAHPGSPGKPATSSSAEKPLVPAHPADYGFVPAPAVKPWQPAAAARPSETTPSVSATARASFAAKQPAAPAPKPAAPPKASATTLNKASAIPLSPKHATGKPAAGKPLLPTDSNLTPQAAQR